MKTHAKRNSCDVYYADQQTHNVHILKLFCISLSFPTCFDAPKSSSGSLIRLLC